MVNVEDASCSLLMGTPTKEWDDLPSPGITFFQNSSKKLFQMEPITDKSQEVLLCNKHNANIIYDGDTILTDVLESGIDKNW